MSHDVCIVSVVYVISILVSLRLETHVLGDLAAASPPLSSAPACLPEGLIRCLGASTVCLLILFAQWTSIPPTLYIHLFSYYIPYVKIYVLR